MFPTNVFVGETLRLFRPICQHPFRFIAERKIERGGSLLSHYGMPLDLLWDRLQGAVRPQKPGTQRLLFSQKTQKQVLVSI